MHFTIVHRAALCRNSGKLSSASPKNLAPSMSQFIDNQAEESEHDDSDASSLEDIAVKKKQKRVKKRALR